MKQPNDTAESASGADTDHVFHAWSAQRGTRYFKPSGGQGSWFWDESGRRYLDFASQLVFLNLGYQHPALIAAIKAQAEVMCTLAPDFANNRRSELAGLIAARAPGDLNYVFFTNAGTEANEHALRMARLHTSRHKVLSAYRSYHGATGGSIALTGDPRRWASEPGMAGVVHFMGPYLYRSPFGCLTEAEESRAALAHLREVIQLEGPATIAAIFLETLVGTNGVLVPPPGYLAGVRALCDEFGILMVCDEVMVGFGRIGEWFAVDARGVTPDLITFAKGVNSGYVPLGGVVVSSAIWETFADRAYPGGLTYSGHPLACAAAVASIRVIEETQLLDHVRQLGDQVAGPWLRSLMERHPSVGEVRGRGLFWAVELVRNRQTRAMLVPFNAAGAAKEPMNELVAACRDLGFWPFSHFNRIHVAPPLVITAEELADG
ncbi:MAG: aspartate aminotransferase family protein, partial [Candidatus Dormiibacterota bacterium]